MKPRKPHIVVFFGGDAAGRDLSSETGYWICQYLPRDSYDVTPVHVLADGTWQVPLGSLPRHGGVEKMMDYLYRGITALPATQALQRLLTRPVAAFFSILRGRGGDDGSMHSVGQLLDIRVVGSPAATCQQTHNKRLSHAIMRDIATVPEAEFYGADEIPTDIVTDVQQSFEFPLFVKPVNQEGSVGTEYAQNNKELLEAVTRAQKYGEIMVQERARGVELTVSLIDTERGGLTVLPPTVVVPRQSEYYDYLAKRHPGRVVLHTSPTDSNSLFMEAEAIAREVYEKLGCQGYASIDMVADDTTVDVLEVNTVPVLSDATPLLQQLTRAKIHPTAWLNAMIKNSLS